MSPQTPEEQAQLAKQTYNGGDYAAAAQGFESAANAYRAQDDHLIAAEMANNQSVALLQAGDAQAALDAVTGTEAVFQKAGDQCRVAFALGNRAAALEALKRLEEAEKAYIASADLLKSLGEEEMYTQVMQSLSALQLRSGRQLEALASMQAGVSVIEKPTLKQRLLKKLLAAPFKRFRG